MDHDVFISHSSKDKSAADAVCAAIEADGVRCWIAPRDILPGATWATSILKGIAECRVMVLVFSDEANASKHIPREVERAANHGIPIAPIRIQQATPAGDLEYFLSSSHWMDAHTPPLDQHLAPFAAKVRALLESVKGAVRETSPPQIAAAPREALTAKPRSNLPASPTSFVGRSADLDELQVRFARQHRLVTLLGPGGCGKTRLALEYAGRASAQFKDGAWFVRLDVVKDPAHVAVESLRAMKIPEPAGGPDADSLAEALAAKQCLIVLDNCEHLDRAPGDLVAAIMRVAVDCRVLATSRVPLNISGESPFTVPALTLPPETARTAAALASSDAVSLFVERVRAIKPAFQLTDALAPTVARICRALDGLPLALELICARLRSTPLEELSKRLDHVLPLLQGAPRDAAARHQTMKAAITWSVEALPAPARTLFSRLAVFSGGWNLDTAVAICADPARDLSEDDCLSVLDQLCDSSLAVLGSDSGGMSRYRFYEPLRQFAECELMEGPDHTAMRDRHADYFLNLAEASEGRLAGVEQGSVVETLEREHKNLLAALRWFTDPSRITSDRAARGLRIAASLWHFWDLHGHFTIGRSALNTALETAARVMDIAKACPYRAKALNSAGYLAFRQGDYAEAVRLSTEAMQFRRALHDPIGEARCLHNLGNTASATGDFTEARGCFDRALVLYRSRGDHAWEAGVLGRMGEMFLWMNRLDEAMDYAGQACALNRAGGNLAWAAMDLHLLGEIHRAKGDRAEARACYRQALDIRNMLGEKARIAVTLAAVAGLVLENNEAALAARLLSAAEHLRSEIGTPLQAAERNRLEGDLKKLRGDLSEPHFNQHWTSGADAPWQTAVEEALQWLEPN